MKRFLISSLTVLVAVMVGCAHGVSTPNSESIAELERQVRAAEAGFAQSMADRDLDAFASFVDEHAMFTSGDRVLRGKPEVVEAWSRFFQGETAPFSWRPERVHVSADGELGGSTGPVMAPDGTVVGQFVSTWRRDGAGRWKVVLDMSPNCG